MKGDVTNTTGQSFRLAIFIGASILVLASSVYGQSGSGTRAVPCMVNYLRLRITTGQDDLRGWDGFSTSKDNLDVTVYFGENGSQLAADVNNNQEWKNKSVHLVEIKLNQAVPLNQIKGIELKHTGSGVSFDAAKASTPLGPAAGIQSPDTWDMQWLEVTAVGGGVGATILRHGPKSFTNGDRVLSTRVQIPANSCNVDERFGRLNPGKKDVQPASGAGSRYGKEQPAPSALQLPSKSSNQQLQNNEIVRQALAHVVQIGPRASVQGGDREYSAIIAIIKRQSAASRSLLAQGVEPLSPQATPTQGLGGPNQGGTLLNGAKVALNPQKLSQKSSAPLLGASQTMSAPGTRSAGPSTSPAATQVNPPSGPTAPHAPGGRQPLSQPIGASAPMPTQICRAGIATVDGAANGVWFSPVAGEDGRFVIQGCGFGSMPGEVYLSGVQYDSVAAKLVLRHVGVSTSPDRVNFTILPNEWKGDRQIITSWSDRQIVAQIDPNASGLYDTNSVTLNVKTADGQILQATGMNFLAAREDQLLKGLLLPAGCTPQSTGPACVPTGVSLAKVTSAAGIVTPQVESPSISLLRSGDTIAVAREIAWFHFPILPHRARTSRVEPIRINWILRPDFSLIRTAE